MKYNEVQGDLIQLAKEGKFDVIAHGCNCQSIMGAGIAPLMAKAFNCDEFYMETPEFNEQDHRINKLGCIDYEKNLDYPKHFFVVNAYTQYDIKGRREGKIDLDYQALQLCLRKMNVIFKGLHIGLPQIGCGLAGGDWNIVKDMIQAELSSCNVTVVIYKPS